MDGAQGWALIGGFFVVQAATLGVAIAVQTRLLKAEFQRIIDRLDKLLADIHAA